MKKVRIGWIGTGVMGSQMCSKVLQEGHEVFVYTRTMSKASSLIEKGAVPCKDCAEVSKNADYVFTIVGTPSEVRDVYFGKTGCFSSDVKGKIFVDMTTTEPALAKEIWARARELGASALDAPVSGGDRGAREGTLSIMVGGEKEDFEKVLPLFKLMGKSIILEGPAGAGQHTKMANQIVIAGTMIGVSEALAYAKKAGLDEETMIKTVSGGAAGCWTLDNLAPRVVRGDYQPGFMIRHFVKDMRIALKEAIASGLDLKGLDLVFRIYKELEDKGMGNLGTQALVKAVDPKDFG